MSPTPVLLTVAEASETLRLSRSTVYELLGAGQLESVTIGRSRRIPVSALASFVDSLRAAGYKDNVPA
jgi:excisionase family DNA binding protein